MSWSRVDVYALGKVNIAMRTIHENNLVVKNSRLACFDWVDLIGHIQSDHHRETFSTVKRWQKVETRFTFDNVTEVGISDGNSCVYIPMLFYQIKLAALTQAECPSVSLSHPGAGKQQWWDQHHTIISSCSIVHIDIFTEKYIIQILANEYHRMAPQNTAYFYISNDKKCAAGCWFVYMIRGHEEKDYDLYDLSTLESAECFHQYGNTWYEFVIELNNRRDCNLSIEYSNQAKEDITYELFDFHVCIHL